MGQYLGPGLLGLGVTAMIAGFMSGMAGNVSAFATVWTYDVYRPLINKIADDAHYLKMGRWCSVLGVFISIATAYSLFFFSNILEFLQVLIFFFICPLFGLVLLGMLWKRATPTAGFVGFLVSIIFSMSMWFYVHSFPEGFRPNPQVTLGNGAVISWEKDTSGFIRRIIVEGGKLEATNVPQPIRTGESEVIIPAMISDRSEQKKVRVLAADVVIAGTQEKDKFGLEGIPLVLKPSVNARFVEITQKFNAAEFNTEHTKYLARSAKAKPMAVNLYSAFWTLMLCMLVTTGVSLFTKPKPDHELKNLVMGLTPLPDEGPCPWYQKPKLWATAVLLALIAINIIFW
jgi:Na+/proline symporter